MMYLSLFGLFPIPNLCGTSVQSRISLRIATVYTDEETAN